MFDGPVRDTAASVDGTRGNDGTCRASVDTAGAVAAVIGGGCAGKIWTVGNNGTEKKPASYFWIDDEAIFSYPADSRQFGPVTFQ